MINYYYATLKVEAITKLNNFKTGCWVDVESPSDQEKEQLVDLGLDESLINDAFDIHEVPRLEVAKGNFYFFARTPVKDPSQANLPTAPILVVIANKGVFSLSRKDLHSIWQPLLNDASVATTQKTKLFILLIKLYRVHSVYLLNFLALSIIRLKLMIVRPVPNTIPKFSPVLASPALAKALVSSLKSGVPLLFESKSDDDVSFIGSEGLAAELAMP